MALDALILEINRPAPEPEVPPGWFTLEEVYARGGGSKSATRNRLNRAFAEGRLERMTIPARNGRGRYVWRIKGAGERSPAPR